MRASTMPATALHTLRLAAALSLALIAAVVLAACGERSPGVEAETEQLSVALDWYVNPDHAGIVHGIAAGYFEEAGLEVSTQVPSDPAAPIRQVGAGRVDLAISYEPEVLLAHQQGAPVIAVGALVQSPLSSLISLPEARINEPEDLRGKTVATAGIPYQEAFLEAILEDAEVPEQAVRHVSVGTGLMPAVLSGRADAMLGGFRNIEGVDLAERGRNPRVVPVDQLGIPSYNELVLVANRDRVEDDPEPIRLFLAALERATDDARANLAESTRSVLAAGDGLDPERTRAWMEATLPLLAERAPGEPYGYMHPAAWEEFAAFLADRGLLNGVPPIDEVMTNELLPADLEE